MNSFQTEIVTVITATVCRPATNQQENKLFPPGGKCLQHYCPIKPEEAFCCGRQSIQPRSQSFKYAAALLTGGGFAVTVARGRRTIDGWMDG